MIVAGRRSWVDAWLGPMLRSSGAGVSTAPVYYDYQAMLEQDTRSDTTVRITVFGSSDKLALTSLARFERSCAWRRPRSATRFIRVQGRTEPAISDSVRHGATQSRTEPTSRTSPSVTSSARSTCTRSTSEPTSAPSSPSAASVVVGTDGQHATYDVHLQGARRPHSRAREHPDRSFGTSGTVLSANGSNRLPGLYGDGRAHAGAGSLLIVRAPASTTAGTPRSGPSIPASRLATTSSPGYPRTTIKAGVGQYHQPPEPMKTFLRLARAGVKNKRAIHYSAGVEQELTENLEVSVRRILQGPDELVVQTLPRTPTERRRLR